MKKKNKITFNNIGKVFNEQTGEIIEVNGDYRITIEEFLNIDVSNEIEFQPDVTFIKSFRGNGIMLKKELTNAELATIVFLSDFICYKDCVLRTNGDARGNALSIQELAKLEGSKYDTLRRIMYSLRDKEVIGFHQTGDANGTRWITVNPFIFCRGTKVSLWVVDFYSNTKWANVERQKTSKK